MNESFYCLVNIPTADTVLEGPRILPENHYDGINMNLRNQTLWPDSELLTIGWYPYVESDAGAPGPYYDRSLSDFVVNPTNVVRNAIYTQQDIETVKRSKDADLQIQLRQYTTNEAAINPKVQQYVQDDTKWYTDQQAALARLTVWDDVANFNTAKPSDLNTVLPNSYVGQSYVEQGLSMQAQNDAATAQTLAAPWDQTELNAFISGNNAAANDPSDATAPVRPGFRLRQGVGVPSEQFNRVVIYREARDDPNPALQTTYKMILTNRQDARNIYIFSYTNSTYLTWRLFEDAGDGTWRLEATPAEWQYVPGDMSFIFSYGTNPAVEADYFTDRVEFPAGVQTKQVLVAWDSA